MLDYVALGFVAFCLLFFQKPAEILDSLKKMLGFVARFLTTFDEVKNRIR
jgi:hypothetical protein